MTRHPFEDFLDVRLHLAVAEHGSVRLAAASERISQPAASKRLRALERRAGASLYELSPRGARLTAAGDFWRDQASALLGTLDDAAAHFAEAFHESDRLRIAASYIIADYLLPDWLFDWSGTQFHHSCDVDVQNSIAVENKVLAGDVELGLLEHAGELHSDLVATPLMLDELILVAAPSSPLTRLPAPLTPPELAATPLVRRESSSRTQVLLGAALTTAGHTMTPAALEVGSTTAVKAAAARGVAPAIVPELSLRAELDARQLVRIPITGLDLTVTVLAVRRRGRVLSRLARDLLAHLKRRAGQSDSPTPDCP